MEYYPSKKGIKLGLWWMNLLESVIQVVSQKEKNKYRIDNTHIWNLEKWRNY